MKSCINSRRRPGRRPGSAFDQAQRNHPRERGSPSNPEEYRAVEILDFFQLENILTTRRAIVRQVKKGNAQRPPPTPQAKTDSRSRCAARLSVGIVEQGPTIPAGAPRGCANDQARAWTHRRIPPRIGPCATLPDSWIFAAFVCFTFLRNCAADLALLTGLRFETTDSPGPRNPPCGVFGYLDKITSNRLKNKSGRRRQVDWKGNPIEDQSGGGKPAGVARGAKRQPTPEKPPPRRGRKRSTNDEQKQRGGRRIGAVRPGLDGPGLHLRRRLER